MNFKNSGTSDSHSILLNITNKRNLKRSDKYVALSNLSIYYTEKYKKVIQKHLFRHGMKNLNYLMDYTLHQIFKIILNIS